jgi:DNA-directed RNA polymerase specialized sigma subunit
VLAFSPNKLDFELLKEGEGLIVRWYVNEGLTFQQIGDMMGTTRQAAHQAFWRAWRKLQRRRRDRG